MLPCSSLLLTKTLGGSSRWWYFDWLMMMMVLMRLQWKVSSDCSLMLINDFNQTKLTPSTPSLLDPPSPSAIFIPSLLHFSSFFCCSLSKACHPMSSIDAKHKFPYKFPFSGHVCWFSPCSYFFRGKLINAVSHLHPAGPAFHRTRSHKTKCNWLTVPGPAYSSGRVENVDFMWTAGADVSRNWSLKIISMGPRSFVAININAWAICSTPHRG